MGVVAPWLKCWISWEGNPAGRITQWYVSYVQSILFVLLVADHLCSFIVLYAFAHPPKTGVLYRPGPWQSGRSASWIYKDHTAARFFLSPMSGGAALDNTWMVVWNMTFIVPYIGNNQPKWLFIFFRWVGIPPTRYNVLKFVPNISLIYPSLDQARNWGCGLLGNLPGISAVRPLPCAGWKLDAV